MKAMMKGALIGLAMMLCIGTVQNGWALTKGQDKLLAKRAAQVDAYRKLTEMLKGLQINSTTTVADFVAQSDQINAGFDDFVKGLKVVGPPRYFEDGTCEVDVQATLEQVMLALETLVRTDPFGNKTIIRDMVKYNRKKVFVATGTGVAPSAAQPEQVGFETTQRSVTAGIPGWENVTPRGRLMAERAAKVDAYRNLAETVNGLRISGNTYVRDFVAESDEIRTSLNTFLKGARQVGPPRYMADGIVEVEVDITLQKVIKHLQTLQQQWIRQGRRFRITEFRNTTFETIVGYYPKKVISAVGNGTVPAKYMRNTVTTQTTTVSTPAIPQWATQMIQATGFGVPADGQTGTEARLMAERAAKLDAMRNLTEKVYGVYIDSTTTVRDFATENDTIQARVKQRLAAAEQVGEPRYLPDGSVEVTVQMPMSEIFVIYKEVRRY